MENQEVPVVVDKLDKVQDEENIEEIRSKCESICRELYAMD